MQKKNVPVQERGAYERMCQYKKERGAYERMCQYKKKCVRGAYERAGKNKK